MNPTPDSDRPVTQFVGEQNADWTPVIAQAAPRQLPDMAFCLVPAGTFLMGSDRYANEKPVHPQTLAQSYWIGRDPVTNAQWRTALEAGIVPAPHGHDPLKWYHDANMADAPVVGVSWTAAQTFCAWAGCRLPTELEWEYAARGVESTVYAWGNTWDETRAVWSKNSLGFPNAVTTRPEGQSWVGARHMSGNIWEWTHSLYQAYPYVADDGREADTPDLERVLRGGAWYGDMGGLRAAYRIMRPAAAVEVHIGFRCAL